MRRYAYPLSQRVQGQTHWAACNLTWLKNFCQECCHPQTLCHDGIIWYEGHGEMPGEGWWYKPLSNNDENRVNKLPNRCPLPTHRY